MRNPKITLAFDEHRSRGVVSLRFEKKFPTAWLGHGSSKRKEIYTHVPKQSLARIKNPLDNLLKGKGGEINDLE